VPDRLIIEGDPVRLRQVVVNLLNNAAKYTPDGGRITVTAR
jgi:signal transduction histidine kinase